MHPLLASRLRLALYLSAWLFVGFVFAVKLSVIAGTSARASLLYGVPVALFYGLACLSAWWVCRANPLGAESWRRTLGMLLLAAVVQSVILTLTAAVWWPIATRISEALPFGEGPLLPGIVLPAPMGPLETRRAVLGTIFIAGIPLYLLSAIVHYLLLAFERARDAERSALESRVVARDAELRALRAQLNPHFLFNSLNSISALVVSQPEDARRMCEGLGDFLRRTLALASHETVPLADEVSLVERYLAIERVRFGDRLGVETHVSGDAAHCLVPPLLLQPLVENAVKHGVAERIEGGMIRIEANVAEGRLRVRVENPCDDEPAPHRGQGMGLDNVRGRLHALDPHGSQLTATRAEGRFRVMLDLPAVEPHDGLAVAADEPASSTTAARPHGSAAPAGGPSA